MLVLSVNLSVNHTVRKLIKQVQKTDSCDFPSNNRLTDSLLFLDFLIWQFKISLTAFLTVPSFARYLVPPPFMLTLFPMDVVVTGLATGVVLRFATGMNTARARERQCAKLIGFKLVSSHPIVN